MKQFPKITVRERILFLAPHPDDESLAAGGLLQRAVAAGAQVAVIFASDGDKNPWPQRALERKWNIRSGERTRWGKRRRAEALSALDRLSIPRESALLMGFPDQGFTSALLSASNAPLAAIADAVEEFRPTIFIAPSLGDRHPDHSALGVIARVALDRSRSEEKPCMLVHYVVHTKGAKSGGTRLVFKLTAEEIAQKRNAILAHQSQMILSRARFLAYARPHENFFRPPEASAGSSEHPIIHAEVAGGALHLRIRKTGRTWANTTLLIAAQSLTDGDVRWALRLSPRSACVRILNLLTGESGRRAAIRVRRNIAQVVMPINALGPLERIFAKVTRPSLFFDQHGWRELPAQKSPSPLVTEGQFHQAPAARKSRMHAAA